MQPDFFIVGAPKCGTTALDSYLKAHPEIFIPARKELHFFGTDLRFWNRPTLEEYTSHFKAADGRLRVGESSVWYLYSERAATEIKDFSPEASIIVMLRNPVDFLHSLHSQMLYTLKDDIPDFLSALDAEEDRKAGKRLPKLATRRGAANFDLKLLYYREVAAFSRQLERYYNAFSRDKVHVIIYDDFKQNTPVVYRRVLDFLAVDSGFAPEFRVINANRQVRNRLVQRLLRYPPRPIVKAARSMLPNVEWRRAVKSRLFRLNEVPQQRAPIDAELRRRLQQHFRPEVERLSSLLQRDLTFWCNN